MNALVEGTLKLVAGWDHVCQILFLAVFGMAGVGLLITLMHFVAVLARGWPPPAGPAATPRRDEPEEDDEF